MFELFKKRPVKKPEKPGPRKPMPRGTQPPENLIKRVRDLYSRGLSEADIMKTARGEGYSSLDIDNAIRLILKEGVGEPVSPTMERPASPKHPESEFEMPHIGEPKTHVPKPPEERPEHEPAKKLLPRKEHPPREHPGRKDIEELVEANVDEKWGALDKKLKESEAAGRGLEDKMAGLEQKIEALRQERETEMKEVSAKIDAYKDSMAEISSKMEGMEVAMRESLSPLMETLRSLSDTLKLLKGKKK